MPAKKEFELDGVEEGGGGGGGGGWSGLWCFFFFLSLSFFFFFFGGPSPFSWRFCRDRESNFSLTMRTTFSYSNILPGSQTFSLDITKVILDLLKEDLV